MGGRKGKKEEKEGQRDFRVGHESKKRQDEHIGRKRKDFPEGKGKQRENGEKAKRWESRLMCPGFQVSSRNW